MKLLFVNAMQYKGAMLSAKGASIVWTYIRKEVLSLSRFMYDVAIFLYIRKNKQTNKNVSFSLFTYIVETERMTDKTVETIMRINQTPPRSSPHYSLL